MCRSGNAATQPGLPELLSSKERNARFEAVVLPNLKALHRKAWCLLRDPSAADDMVQETACGRGKDSMSSRQGQTGGPGCSQF